MSGACGTVWAMGVTREFLHWNKPALPAAASWLIDRAEDSSSHTCDLRETSCVLPGRRAGRLLLSHLIIQCRARKLQLLPPPTATPGQMIDSLLEIHQPRASDVETHWAWVDALKRADRDAIQSLLPKRPPDDDWRSWLELARLAANLHTQLAGARIRFQDVALHAQRMEMVGEADRWMALAEICVLYLQTLQRHGLSDVNEAREARLASFMTTTRKAARTLTDARSSIVLIGTVELNQLQRAALAAAASPTTALIHAPSNLADHFDDCGCVIPAKWEHAEVGLSDAQIVIADRPADQSQKAIQAVADLQGEYTAGQITIGVGTAELAPVLQHAGQWAGLSLRSAEGAALAVSPPCRALKAIGDWLRDDRFIQFAAMLRHPDIERWVRRRTRDDGAGVSDWLSLLDKYFADHLHERIAEEWLGDDWVRARLQAVHRAVTELCGPLAAKPITRAVREWCQPMLDVLVALYEGEIADESHSSKRLRVEACTTIRDALAEFDAAPHGLQPQVTASQAIELALDAIASQFIPEELQSDQIEMLGWLELHLDDAPALIITGFNEGNVPESAGADPFLPDSLRGALGLTCNATRYARDAYVMEAIRHSRDSLKVIAGRSSADGEPLSPSRLLLACKEEALVNRVTKFCGESGGEQMASAPIGLGGVSGVESKFVVPALPLELLPREAMSITEFRDYLKCPYRYALKRLLRLEAKDDSATELDALQFGNLAHDALCEFGRDDKINACEDAEKIEAYLIRVVDSLAPQKFGKSCLPAIAVQLARLKQRLCSFARLQAKLSAEGWRVRHCELEFNANVSLDIPGQAPMPLRGKIDRIDCNEGAGTWRIIDYKTGDSAESPHRSHHGCEDLPDEVSSDWAWRDLQLPLYHYLVRQSALGIDGEIALAYICLPKQAGGVRLSEAQWTSAYLDHAIETARDVVRNIRAERFAMNPDFDGRFDELARICQTAAFIEREAVHAVEDVGGELPAGEVEE